MRTSAIWGSPPGKANFATFVVDRLRTGGTIKALIDQYVSPTNNRLLAKAVAEIVELKPLGILHVAGERMSRYEFAVRVAEALSFDKSLIHEARMEEFKWLARRPKDSSLSVEETKERVRTDFHSTKLAMEVLREEYERGLPA